jgi:hypothetical protein
LNPKAVVGKIPLNDDTPPSELPVRDEMDEGRRCFKKGRLEFMGGPVYFEQAHDYEVKGMNMETLAMETERIMDNNRKMGYGPMSANNDDIAKDLGVDITEQ